MEQTNQLNQNKTPRQHFYLGQSMKGTFRQGDVLTIQFIPFEKLKPGDVVVFTRQNNHGREKIVHRVMRRFPGGVITRGDASTLEDCGVVTEQNLVGRVVSRERNGRISIVHGGWVGLCRGRGLHFYWRTRRRAVRVILKPYAGLKASGIVPRLWKPKIFRVKLNSENGPCIQHVWKNRIVGRFWPEENRFECRKPWDLFIANHPTKKISS